MLIEQKNLWAVFFKGNKRSRGWVAYWSIAFTRKAAIAAFIGESQPRSWDFWKARGYVVRRVTVTEQEAKL